MARSVWKSLVGTGLLCVVVVSALWPSAAVGRSPAPANSHSIGFESFEPTMGATSNGDLYFSITPSHGVAVGWRAGIAKSRDKGVTWKDVGPTLPTGHSNPPETNDPYIYVDPSTNRIFTFHMAPILTCSILSFSDDGGRTWQSNPKGCSPTGPWDHQTIVAAKPRTVETDGYPNVLIQCVNAVYAAMCARSVDGGLSWGVSHPVHINTHATEGCGSQHGHLAAGPDGRVYLPTSRCGSRPTVFVSSDDGESWRESVIADMDTPFVDPTVSVDSKGNLYAAFINEDGWLYYATSRNKAKSWSKPVRFARAYTANMPVIVAGDPGRAVIAYPATNDLPKGYATKGYLDGNEAALVQKVAWGANFSVTYDGLSKRPRFRTKVATGTDPIGRGRVCVRATRCDYLVDFIEAVIGPDGRPYASFVDGCLGACANSPSGEQKRGTGIGLLTTLRSGRRLCKSTCWRYKRAGKLRSTLGVLGETLTPSNPAASLRHGHLSPRERVLQRRATQRRLEAVRN